MEPIQNFLYPAVAQLLRRAPLSEEKLLCAWRIAVGAGLARVTHVRLGPAGVLDVALADGRWYADVHRSRALILDRMQQVLGADTVKEIDVREPPAEKKARRPGSRRTGSR